MNRHEINASPKTASIPYLFFRFMVLLMFLDSMYPWYVWDNQLSIFTVILTGLSLVVLAMTHKQSFSRRNVTRLQMMFIGLYLFYYILFHGAGLGLALTLFIWCGIIYLRQDLKIDIFRFITKWFGILIIITATAYLLWLTGLFRISPRVVVWNDGQYIENNYYFFLISRKAGFSLFYRFKSIFMEPGHMTIGIVPLLVANRFNLKNRYVLFLFIGELLSFSLAGYLTMAIGYLLLLKNNHFVKRLAGGILFVALAVYVVNATGYSFLLDKYLWDRLELTEKGTIAGDNRTSARFDRQYEQVLAHPTEKWFGKSDYVQNFGDGGNAGFKVHIVRLGIIGVFLMVMMYLSVWLSNRKYPILVLTIIILLLLYQSGGPTWAASMYGFTLGCANLLSWDQSDRCLKKIRLSKKTYKNIGQIRNGIQKD